MTADIPAQPRPESDPSAPCVFCTREEQPGALYETALLFAMPDKFPMLPGHTLLISREHLPCYAAAPDPVTSELTAAAGLVRRFLEGAYGSPVLHFENGIAGQTVFHAHLHLIPVPIAALPADILAHEEVLPVEGWPDVRTYFARHDTYRYVELGGARSVLPGYSPVLRTMRRLIAAATGLARDEHGWIKTTTPEDVREVGRRWGKWTEDEHRATAPPPFPPLPRPTP